ncbi:hypothetical protein [Gloeothece verrucosa]|uniref:Uncharacterized protein n=1 Tax=Gloeothece verrucosa (strain PCC 7822) TaxID=497965 RepID=E0UNE6_GLOV7|nr:hypothetical protein [Gloeothece verrucosa]ADN18476.1 conserved hypothetical protein [Gloeothece verrucosa PCC 7822]
MFPPTASDSLIEITQAPIADSGIKESTDPSTDEELQKQQHSYFQAIGCLYGKVTRSGEGQFFIQLGRQQYKLYTLRHRYRAWLTQWEKTPDASLYLKVYPKFLAIPRQPVIISFQVVAWGTEPFPAPEEEAGIFTIKGIWQFLPQYKVPCLSVYRNRDAVDPTEKFKAVHLPVLMRREDEEVRPFKFNPRIPKDQLPKKWFIQGKFRFIPSKECFGWVEDDEPPTQKLPKYKKPVKAEPTPGDKPNNRTPKPFVPVNDIKPNREPKTRPVLAVKQSG